MSYITKKKIKGHDYFYLMESKRIKGKVKTKTLAYLGKTKKGAELKLKQMQQLKREVKITYFVHGTTTDNEKGIATGQAHGKLSILGIKQSEDLPKQIGKKEFDIVFCSDLKRAIDSAKISFGNKYKIIQDKRLRECNYGDLNQTDEEKIIYSEHIETPFPKGESLKDVERRIKDFLEFLKKNYNGKTIAIVAHKAPQLALDVLIKGKKWEQSIKEDWRKKKAWQPGWEYTLTEQKVASKLEIKQEIKILPVKYEDIIELASRRSLFYPSSEIYSTSPAGFWNFGPYGASIRRKIIQLWRKELVEKENMIEIYGSQILPKEVFESSGHLISLVDPIIECKKCKSIFRADKLLSEKLNKNIPEALTEKEFDDLVTNNKIKCPKCNSELSNTKKTNLMLGVNVGIANPTTCYLRPETCQSIFLDFIRMVKTMRVTLPKGIAQVGRSFRNEISPRQSLFREVEFSQFEAEIFFNPGKINEIENFDEIKNYKLRILRVNKEDIEEITAEELVNKKMVQGRLIAYYLARIQQLFEKYGIKRENIRFREVGENDRAFYSGCTFDLEVLTKLGWMESVACNYRTDYDLKVHAKGSKQDLSFIEDDKKFIPHIFEISAGVDRTFYAVIDNSFTKEPERIVLKLNPKLSPYDCAIFPLVNKEKLPEISKDIFKDLINDFEVFYDDSGSVGRRYRRMDEIGVKYCVTIDFDSIKNKDVTVRERDSMKQIRVKIKNLNEILKKLINSEIEFEKAGKIIK